MKSYTARIPDRALALLAAFAMLAALMVLIAPAAQADQESDRNETAFWLAEYPYALECYKNDNPGTASAHGNTTADGKAVVLNPYGATWPGDHYEVLVVNSGSSGGDDGYGNMIYYHPSAGSEYAAPNGNDVSHWIVCKGEDRGGLVVGKAIVDYEGESHADLTFDFVSKDLEELLDTGEIVVQLGHEETLGGSVPVGSYDVSEVNIPEGWVLFKIVCDDENSTTSGSTATFNVELGETVTCVFHNEESI